MHTYGRELQHPWPPTREAALSITAAVAFVRAHGGTRGTLPLCVPLVGRWVPS